MKRPLQRSVLLWLLLFVHPVVAQIDYYDGCSTPTVYTIRLDSTTSMTFRFVPTDTGDYRIDNEGRRIGRVRGFFVGETEVTQRQWQAVMGATAFATTGDDLPAMGLSLADIQLFVLRLDSLSQQPVRLPALQEWCYAAQGGEPYPYAGDRRAQPVAWCRENSGGHLHPVAQRVPNAWGFYDMSGNVAEWTANSVEQAEASEPMCYIPVGGSYEDAATQCDIPLNVLPRRREELREPLSATAASLLCFEVEMEVAQAPTIGLRLLFDGHLFRVF